MTRNTESCFRRVLGDKSGVASVVGAVGIVLLLGFAAVSVDAGYVFSAWNQLQASTEAAALAGAKDIGVGGTPIATATSYSSVSSSDKNYIAGVTTTMAAGYPALACFKYGPACTTNQTPATAVNGIQVKQTATVPLYFARVLGISSVNITASAAALAAGQAPPPLNVMMIVDATASMGDPDATCGSSKIQCAVEGFELLLGKNAPTPQSGLWPCTYDLTTCGTVTNHNVANPVDKAALLQFPGVQSLPTGTSCASLSTVAYAGINGKTSATTASTSTTLHFAATPAFNTGTQALVTDMTNPTYIQAGTYIMSTTGTTAVMSTTPTSGETIGSGDSIDVWPPIYQIIPLSSDYRTSDTVTTLNASSDLVSCLTVDWCARRVRHLLRRCDHRGPGLPDSQHSGRQEERHHPFQRRGSEWHCRQYGGPGQERPLLRTSANGRSRRPRQRRVTAPGCTQSPMAPRGPAAAPRTQDLTPMRAT